MKRFVNFFMPVKISS